MYRAQEAQRNVRQVLTMIDSLMRLDPPVADEELEVLAAGEEALRRVIDVCDRIGQGRGVRRANEAQRVLRQALSVISGLGTLTTSEDSDLIPEETRNEMVRRRREQARQESRRGV